MVHARCIPKQAQISPTYFSYISDKFCVADKIDKKVVSGSGRRIFSIFEVMLLLISFR